jgi:ABC-type transport system substrate-binding protein
MNSDDRGHSAGADARRAGAGFSPPDLARTIRRRRRARTLGTILGSALALVAAVGIGALLMRTESDVAPVDTTTTTSPQQTVSTTTVTTSPETTTTAATLATEPGYGGIVKVASNTDLVYSFERGDGTRIPPTINPLLHPTNAADVARLTVPGAFRIDPGSSNAVSWVVNPIPTIGNGGVTVEDGRATITYHIDPRAVWADGTPVTYEDFAFTLGLIMNEELPIDPDLRDLHILIDPDTLAGHGDVVTFQITRPDPRYDRLFPWLVPAHAVAADTFADDWNDQLWMSGGPFVFDGYEPSSSPDAEPGVIHLGRNDNYWETDNAGNQLPYLDGIEMQVFPPSIDGTISWFTTRSTDIALPGLIFPWSGSLGDPEEEGFVLGQAWDTLFEVIGFELRDTRFEVNPDSLNSELLYRQAVLSAIDRNALSVDTGYPVATSIAGTGSPALDIDVWQQYDDPAQAGDLLAQLGETLRRDFTTEPPTAVYTSSPGDATIVIGDEATAQLEAAGWDVTTDYTWDFFNVNIPEGRDDILALRLFAREGLAELATGLAAFDPTLPNDQILFDWSSVGEPARRYADIVAEAQVTLDLDRLAELVIEAESILADNAIVYPLVRRQVSLMPYWPERIQGVTPHQGWTTATAAWWWSPAQAADAGDVGGN